MPSNACAIYIRSSKDRHELALPAQRTDLRAYAQAHDLKIVAEFSDLEVSGALDEVSRPGLRKMLAAMAEPARKWDVLLAVDTSRIARDLALALAIQRECDRHRVDLRYSKVAVDGKTPAGEMFLTLDRAVSQYHSRISAAKGKAGLETNVALGFRAGGSAPYGYKLQHHETGATRGGVAVRKSKLVLDPRPARRVKRFLEQRAAGVPRFVAAKAARIDRDKSASSLIALERNALTYAGFLVWHTRKKHRPTKEDPRRTMLWRPRSEWLISPKPVHEALITREQAERILAAVEVNNPKPKGFAPQRPDAFVLTGLLFGPDGTPWQGDGKFYRLGARGRRVLRSTVDNAVLRQIAKEIRGKAFIAQVVGAAHRMAEQVQDDPRALDQAIRSIDGKLAHLADVIAEGGAATLVAKVRELEAERARLQDERANAAQRTKLKGQLQALRPQDVHAMVEFAAEPLPGVEPDVQNLRTTLGALVQRIEFDPGTRRAQITYRMPALGGVQLASPRLRALPHQAVHVAGARWPLPAPRRGPAPARLASPPA